MLNTAYKDIQEHFGTVIVPAPPLKPKGKSSVENHVRHLETHLLGKLRGRHFTSWMALNQEIKTIMEEINTRPFQKDKKENRLSMFLEFDKPMMKSLPKDSFCLTKYIARTVPSNYHIEYDHHHYSVPYSYFRQEVTCKISDFASKICDSMNHLICVHKRAYKPYPKYITIPEHMPENHQYYYTENRYSAKDYVEWASRIGTDMQRFILLVIQTFDYEEQSYRSINGILHLTKGCSYALCNQAAKQCMMNHTIGYSYYQKELNRLSKSLASTDEQLPEHKNIRGKETYR